MAASFVDAGRVRVKGGAAALPVETGVVTQYDIGMCATDRPENRLRWPRESRLRKRGEISHVFEQGMRVNDGRLTVVACPNGTGGFRGGVAVSRRHGNAVQRNRLKRICREAMRLTGPELPGGWDVIVIPRRGREATLAGTIESFRRLLDRITSRHGRQEAGP